MITIYGSSKKIVSSLFTIILTLIIGLIFIAPVWADASNTNNSIREEKIAQNTKYETELYIIDSGKPGPTVLVVGGVHGSEIAGVRAAHRAKDINISRGRLLVLPEANKRAVEIQRRFVPGENDLNREFPKSRNGRGDSVLARAIWNDVIKKYKIDWLMDMHEGLDFYKNPSTSSVGQTIIYYPPNNIKRYIDNIANDLNKNISRSREKFEVLRYPTQGSLARSAAQFEGINAFIFETSMKDNLNTRIKYQETALKSLLKQLKMI